MPVSGAWRVTYHMQSRVTNLMTNQAWIYLNGRQLPETMHKTSVSARCKVDSTSGRVVTLEANEGDLISLRTYSGYVYFFHVNFCVHFIPRI